MEVLQEYLCCTKNTKPISTLSKTRKTSHLNYQKNIGMFYLFFFPTLTVQNSELNNQQQQ